MTSLLLWTRSKDWQTQLGQAVLERGHEVVVCEHADAVMQAILADVHELLFLDEMVLRDPKDHSPLSMLSQAGYQGKVVVLSRDPALHLAPSESNDHSPISISEIVHVDASPTSQQLQRLLAYFDQSPRSKWAGLTFESLPGFQQIQARYKDKLPAHLQSLQQSFDARGWSDLQKQAHAIKGGAGSFGLPRLTELAAQLDKAARAQDEADAKHWLALIQREFGGGT